MIDSPRLATRKFRITSFSALAVIWRKIGRTKARNIGSNSRDGPGKRLLQSRAIRNSALFSDAQAKLKNLPRDEAQVRIQHMTQQEFGTGVDDEDAHALEEGDWVKELHVTMEKACG